MDDQTARFLIDDREYEVPDLDSFTMGEAVVLYDYSGLSVDEVIDHPKHPGVISAFMHIAYQRGNPAASKASVRELVESCSLVEALSKLAGDEPNPPEQRKIEEQPSLPPSSSSSDKSSGPGSDNNSDVPDVALKSIGASR